jgi:hypothetical protein
VRQHQELIVLIQGDLSFDFGEQPATLRHLIHQSACCNGNKNLQWLLQK